MWSCRPYQNLGQTDRYLHDYVFDDVICKPPVLNEMILTFPHGGGLGGSSLKDFEFEDNNQKIFVL